MNDDNWWKLTDWLTEGDDDEYHGWDEDHYLTSEEISEYGSSQKVEYGDRVCFVLAVLAFAPPQLDGQ